MRVSLCHVQNVDESLATYALQLGVTSINITTPELPAPRGYWMTDDIAALRKKCESLGLRLEGIENTAHDMYDQVMVGGPRRDQQLENYQQTIRSVAAAGVPVLGFHFMPTAVWRTDLTAPGRGGAEVTAYDHQKSDAGNKVIWPADEGAARLSADAIWANYEYFLDAVLPVADEVGLLLAHHPDDPPVEEIRGFARVFNTPENLVRAMGLAKGSTAWGLTACLGTISEMEGGARAVSEVIEYFGSRGKIRYVHMRDVQGTVPMFQECFINEGNYSPAAVIKRLDELDFDGWIQDDHVPGMSEDTSFGHRARAHAIGYMQGIIESLESSSIARAHAEPDRVGAP